MIFGGLREVTLSPLVSRKLVRAIHEYARKGFHPNDHDTTALIESWREQLFGEHGGYNSPTCAELHHIIRWC